MSNVNVITTDSDEFARQAMAYLESRGFKVTKEKLTLPVVTYKGTFSSQLGIRNIHIVDVVSKMEIDHICKAYRAGYEAGQSGKYKTAEQYLADEYNDFTS
jgi:TolA-binding protein